MRCRNIRIHAEIPVDGAFASGSTFCDGNGVVYSVEAVRKACENIGNLPIIQYDEHGVEKVVGVAQSIRWNPRCHYARRHRTKRYVGIAGKRGKRLT